ncbi:MAG: hypothetical protein HYS13_17460, partial [Planctomycetia bacterium]|nr:hypothetical protein [Planctomycetia bacterium]
MTDFAEFEQRVARFEAAWQGGRPPRIEDFLPPSTGDGNHAAARAALLAELICVDLEFRWRRATDGGKDRRGANGPTLNDYLREFPELGALGDLPLALIGEEYRVRQRFGDRPSPEAFAARFAERKEKVGELLAAIDRQLKDERDDPILPVAGAASKHRIASPPAFDPRAPLDHRDFLVQKMLGAGRMGRVYRALQKSLDRSVAVKHLRKAFLAQPDVVERFLTEARTVALFRH